MRVWVAGALAGCLFFISAPVTAATWMVPSMVPTIQAAVDSTVPGDTVLVDDGVYRGVGNRDIDFHGKDILVRSRNGADVTVIDCEYLGRAFLFLTGETSEASVHGFTLTEGDPDDLPGRYSSGDTDLYGGAVLIDNASPTFRECTFYLNGDPDDLPTGGVDVAYGGAVSVKNGRPLFQQCAFERNGAAHGGAVHCEKSTLLFQDCAFRENLARSSGGGLYVGEGAEVGLLACDFEGNEVRGVGGAGGDKGGGGAVCADRASIKVQASRFVDNRALNGGAIDLGGDSYGSFSSCEFIHNEAISGGGAVRTRGSVTCTGSLMSMNVADLGGAIQVAEGRLSLETTTLAENEANRGGGIYCAGGEIHAGSVIIAFSSVGEAVFCAGSDCMPVLVCSNLYGNAGGDWVGCLAQQTNQEGNIHQDPLFCFHNPSRYLLEWGSPCLEQNGTCGRMGAFGGGCVTREESPADGPEGAARARWEPASWGVVKTRFK